MSTAAVSPRAASGVAIRPVQAADQTDWRRLWTGYLDFYETKVSEEVYETTWSRLLSGGPGEYQGLIARAAGEGEALGLAHVLRHRHCWSVADVCYLQDLFVAPAARGLGVGRALIETVYRLADESGAANVYWLTQEHNATARALYDRIATKTPFIKYTRR